MFQDGNGPSIGIGYGFNTEVGTLPSLSSGVTLLPLLVKVTVPHSQSGAVPMSSLSGVE